MDVVALHHFLARAGRTWDEVTVVDAGAVGLRHAVNVCRARPAVVVSGSPSKADAGATPSADDQAATVVPLRVSGRLGGEGPDSAA